MEQREFMFRVFVSLIFSDLIVERNAYRNTPFSGYASTARNTVADSKRLICGRAIRIILFGQVRIRRNLIFALIFLQFLPIFALIYFTFTNP